MEVEEVALYLGGGDIELAVDIPVIMASRDENSNVEEGLAENGSGGRRSGVPGSLPGGTRGHWTEKTLGRSLLQYTRRVSRKYSQ